MKHQEQAAGTRRHILRSALKRFADRGYAATSVQDIVRAAGVSKPALYYHFGDKAGLFQALVDQAHDERYRLMQEAAKRGGTVAEQLEEILAAVFAFSLKNQALMRLAFATAFNDSGESPCRERCVEKGQKNFDFLKGLLAEGQRRGELARHFDLEDLTMGIYGQITAYVMVRLLVPDCRLDRPTAKQIVRLFLEGARGDGESGKRNGSERPNRRVGK